MYKAFLSLLFTLIVWDAASQKVYFVYLQTEQEQPFFVKMNEKLYSSTGSGYLILSKLVDSTYSFSIGFPQNKWPEQRFTVPVRGKDHGYLLKNFGESRWGLFDLQTLSVQMAAIPGAGQGAVVKTENKNVSAFTDILSKAADDPSLKEKTVQPKTEEEKPKITIQEVAKKEESKTETKESAVPIPPAITDQPVAKKEEPKTDKKDTAVIKPVEVADPPVIAKEEPKIEIKEPSVTKAEEIKPVTTGVYKKSVIIKKSESSNTEGFGLVFIDNNFNGIKDTIRLIIPDPKLIVGAVKEEPKEEKKFLDILPDTVKNSKEEKVPEVKQAVVDTLKKTQEKITDLKQVVTEPAVSKGMNKNNCPDIAGEADFFKLRKEMATAESDDDMITEARKYFKVKCFTVTQVKNLSALFLNDAGKYKFFDLAYAYVSDIGNFALLQSEIKDEYYINRFKAMLRN